jgi:hypothetical protein
MKLPVYAAAECARRKKEAIESAPAMIQASGKITMNPEMAGVAKERPGVTNV